MSLIYNEVGTGPIPIETWNDVFKEPNVKYNSNNLGKSIDLCKKFNLLHKMKKIIYIP
ncbi:hypothetical protein FB1_27850 [Flavobacterium branchiophilum NBRC 15030 = ATCC 35035]|nr:hypothetical protein FB1_27850 [Flavobacterium branchiophilum NBRC 15030 = ATCC 35035]